MNKAFSYIKQFFVKKSFNQGVVTKNIFGIAHRYVRGKYYLQCLRVLKYIEPYLDTSISNVIDKFEQQSKLKHISLKQHAQNMTEYQNILDNFNPSVLKPVGGKLREIQLKELAFAKEILNDMEENKKITPFMDDGTLLGAVRHGGFIPWDNDMDFSLMREDFEKLEKYFQSKYIQIDISDRLVNAKDWRLYLNSVLEKYPNQIFFWRQTTSMNVFRGTVNDYCCCDFFPLDYYDDYVNAEMLQRYSDNVRSFITDENQTLASVMSFQKSEREHNKFVKKESNNIQVGIDNFDFIYYTIKGMRRKTDIFPLKKMKFEDAQFWAPNNPHEYLKTLYNDYNKIPVYIRIGAHTGAEHPEDLLYGSNEG